MPSSKLPDFAYLALEIIRKYGDGGNFNITFEISGKKNHIDTIINCAAYTSVDKAENERKNADLVNRKAVKKLAKISNHIVKRFIQTLTLYMERVNAMVKMR